MIFQQVKLETIVIPHVHVIWNGQSIFETIQGHFQGQRSILLSSERKYNL